LFEVTFVFAALAFCGPSGSDVPRGDNVSPDVAVALAGHQRFEKPVIAVCVAVTVLDAVGVALYPGDDRPKRRLDAGPVLGVDRVERVSSEVVLGVVSEDARHGGVLVPDAAVAVEDRHDVERPVEQFPMSVPTHAAVSGCTGMTALALLSPRR
jgi:hypothetical protein